MQRLSLALVVSLAMALGAASAPSHAQASAPSAVTPWIELELNAIASHRTNPPRASRALAHLSTAMHLAALPGESGQDDAVAGAASTVVAHFYPDEAAGIQALADRLADVESKAFAAGRLAGRLLIARARSDGADAVWTGTVPQGPGYWVPTPPAYIYPPLELLAGAWRTWNLRSGSEFRPGPPPEYGSAQFLAETNEVYEVSQNLTDAQKRIAEFWADGAGTVTPPGHWNSIAIELVPAGWSTLREAQLFATLNTAQADAFIACWDAKYAYWSLRPVTAIRQLGLDPNWLSYIATPPFPSYVSGHSTTSGAASTVLAGSFPDRARELGAIAEEAAISRIYGGIHFRSDNEAGLDLGRRVGSVALDVYRVGR